MRIRCPKRCRPAPDSPVSRGSESVQSARVAGGSIVVVIAPEFGPDLQEVPALDEREVRLDAPGVVRFVAEAARAELRIRSHVEPRELVVIELLGESSRGILAESDRNRRRSCYPTIPHIAPGRRAD